MIRIALVLFLAVPLFAQEWDDLLARANREHKPIVILFRGDPCERCAEFERVSLRHPTIERRLPGVVFAIVPTFEPSYLAFYDRAGVLRARWPMVPDTMNFGIILDSVTAVAKHFDCAVELFESGAPGNAELEVATGLARLGRINDAQAALARAKQQGATTTVANAQPKRAVVAQRAIRVVALERQVVSGRHTVRTHVTRADIARVTFTLDGREVHRAEQPPFSASLDFGTIPERHAIRVTAFDRQGREIGSDERVVNEAGESFWLRFTSPATGPADGAVRVSMNVRKPAARRVERVVVSWNDAERAVIAEAPFETTVRIPEGQIGVLRAVAELDDGRTSEDAVLLNAGGWGGQANVQLVELPITMLNRSGTIAPADITVREGKQLRRVEAVATADETPLTVGLLMDISGSMQKTLPDLQEAAIRFLRTLLGKRDRAFLVAFDSYAQLLQPATTDVDLLDKEIMRVTPGGQTALHDALVLGLLQFEGIKGRRALIVFSDGADHTSQYRAADVRELARRVNVPIHVIESIPNELTDGALLSVGRATGGTAHRLQRLDELPAVYARIDAALRAQLLAFIRTDPATRENEWRPVDVKIKGAGEVYAPEGYYAAW